MHSSMRAKISTNVGLDPYFNAHAEKSKVRPNRVSLYSKRSGSIANFKDKSSTTTFKTVLTILNASLLVSGTTIGGGFLALPAVVAPSGFFPSAITLICVWLYFLAQSFVLVECITRAKSDNTSAQQQDQDQSIAATAKSVFGVKGEIIFGTLLTILIQATLVSQISRAGMMFPNYRLGCLISALSISGIVFGPKSGIIFASKANAILTSMFLVSCMAVFGCGVQIADWSNLTLNSNWSSVFPAIPTFLQLLVYGEIIPSICEMLKYNTKHVHSAIVLGSFMTLCLQIGWSGLGLCLVSSSSSLRVDPVNILLSSSGPVQIPLFCLAFTAILTTILGSYLALLSTTNNLLNRMNTTRSSIKKSTSYSNSLAQRMKVASIISIPAILIACTSPNIFLQAIDFAGSYPVLILWGILPPVMNLLQRNRMGKGSSDEGEVASTDLQTAGPSGWITLLGTMSLAMAVKYFIEDFMSLFKIA